MWRLPPGIYRFAGLALNFQGDVLCNAADAEIAHGFQLIAAAGLDFLAVQGDGRALPDTRKPDPKQESSGIRVWLVS